MSKNNGTSWKTKYGIRRVRHEEATLEEAIAAAQDLSDDRNEQIEIASLLIGLPQEAVRAGWLDLAPARKEVTTSVTAAGPGMRQRAVVVETKRPRRATLVTQRNHPPFSNQFGGEKRKSRW